MQLNNLTVQNTERGTEVRWLADGKSMWVLYHNYPEIPYAADMALVSCLVPAMQLKQDITLDSSFAISNTLLSNLEHFQVIYCDWFNQLRKVKITAATSVSTSHNSMHAAQIACFFSGGVDASYTFLSEQQQIDTLLFCYGLDIQLGETERFNTAQLEGAKFAAAFDKTLCIIETNFREIFPTDSYYFSQVVVLIGFALGLGFKRLLVPASHTLKQMEPFGSHPLTDPLISHNHTEVLHHGMAPRTVKTKFISQFVPALDVLRVCNTSPLYNCGVCEKCLRTMATLAIYDKTSKSLPTLRDISKLSLVKVWDDEHYHLWHCIADEAAIHQKTELARGAARICNSYRRRKLAKLILAELKLSLAQLTS